MTPNKLNIVYTVPLRWVSYYSTENVLGALVAIHPDRPSMTIASVAFSLN